MSKHTKEPWGYDGHSGIGAINSDQFNGGYFTAEVMGPDKEANARRIVACVNACVGFSNDELEGVAKHGGFIDQTHYNAKVTKQRDTLLALLQNDAYAISFQTLGQYRSAIIAATKGGAA